MSRCIEFILTECQEEKLVDFLNGAGIVIISPTSRTCSPEQIRRFLKKDESIFWNKAYLAKDSDISNIKMACAESCGHYVIEDTYEAPVIEFRRDKKGKMQNAWIYASFYYYKNDEKKYKGEEYKNLYKNIETWINNNCNIIEPSCRLSGQYCDY